MDMPMPRTGYCARLLFKYDEDEFPYLNLIRLELGFSSLPFLPSNRPQRWKKKTLFKSQW